MTVKRILISIGLMISCAAVWTLWRYLGHFDLRAVLLEMNRFSPARFLTAALLVAAYLLVNTINESIVCREANRPLGVLRPMSIAAIANPIGHAIGLATLSAGAIRMRLYTAFGIEPKAIAYIVGLGTLPFLLGAICTLATAIIVHPQQAAAAVRLPAALLVIVSIIALVLLLGTISMAHRQRTVAMGRWLFTLPSARFLTVELMIGIVEVLLVGSVLYLFIQTDGSLGYLNFIGIYLLAVFLGQLSNSPAGIGVFEAALLTLLPGIPPQQLLAAVIGYRAVFELLPLVLALVLLLLFELGAKTGMLGRLWRVALTEK